MSDLIPLDKAAKMLGLSQERLKEMISAKEMFGYRDGASWKFKREEIERVADEFAIDLATPQGGFGAGIVDDDEDSLFTLDDSSAEISDSVSAGEGSAPGSSDSNFQLSDSELLIDDDDSSSDSSLVPPPAGKKPAAKKPGKGKADADDDDALFGDSSLDLAINDDDGPSKGPGKTGDSVHDDDLLLEDPSGSTGKLLKAMSDKVGDSKDELNLADDDLFDDDLRLADSDSLEDAVDLSSDFEDSDIVLEDSDSSSELVLESNDEGIELGANDSGISLSDSLELGGSDIDDLELPADDMVSMSEAADSDAATFMQEDDFNLTPFEDNAGEESSSSQVIALEDSDLFAGDSEATLLGDNDLVSEPQLLGDDSQLSAQADGGMVPVAAEVPYSLWQIVSLSATSVLLALGFIIAFDVARNLWMPSDRIAQEGLLNLFLQIAGMNQ